MSTETIITLYALASIAGGLVIGPIMRRLTG